MFGAKMRITQLIAKRHLGDLLEAMLLIKLAEAVLQSLLKTLLQHESHLAFVLARPVNSG
ncbi:hypothetical protein [Roseomonas harenae]|uniref:hypothetical protein n=1 Tax=Muricoccus harenae TaxID=2692566 RepID=UPI001331B05F|nr:hypothetical protein [Roseomonas harenae]